MASCASVMISLILQAIAILCFPDNFQIASCGFPGRPGHSFFSPVKTIYTKGMSVTYTCEQKYYLLGSPTRRCTDQGEWTGTLPFCVEETPMPMVMSMNPHCKHQRMIDKDDETCVTIMSADVIAWEVILTDVKTILSVIITVQIDSNSSAEGFKVEVGQLSRESPEVNKPECIENRGFRGIKQTIRQEFNPSTKGRYLYVSDTNRRLKRIRICEIHVITKEHTKFDCGEPESLFHSMLTRDNRQVVRYVCDEGYTVVGNPTRTCDHNGVWSGKPPKCVLNATEFTSSTVLVQSSSQNVSWDCDDGNCVTTTQWFSISPQTDGRQDKSDTNMYVYIGTFVNILLFFGIVGLALYVYRTRISQGTRSNTAHLDMLSHNGYSPCQSADGMFTTAMYHTYEDISNNEVLVIPVPQRTSRLPSCSTRRSVNSTRCSDFRRTPPEIPAIPPDNPRKSGELVSSRPGSRDSYPVTNADPTHIYAEIYENDVTLPMTNRREATSVCSSVAVPISPTRESVASVGLAETIFKSLSSSRPESGVFTTPSIKEDGCTVTLSPVYAQPADETEELDEGTISSTEGKAGYIYTLPYGTKESIAVG